MTTHTSGFSDLERAAMKERAAELRQEAARPRGGRKAADELAVLNRIGQMDDADRGVAERIHAIVTDTDTAPDLAPKLWYGQPAYARGGKVICFFRSGADDKERYSTFGFTPEAGLDDGTGLWATSFAVTTLTDTAVETITELVRKVTT